jgi:5'-deoxynucleotidase YfbR-like HD superfamily hydrolase
MKTSLSKVKEFYKRAYALEHTQRYSMLPVVHRESVASHSFFVALGVRLLHEVYLFDLEVALSMAISHDLGELEISDINHAVKKKYPELAAVIKKVESEAIESFPVSVRHDIIAYNLGHSVESNIVHYADTLQVVQYAQSEMALGNAGYMAHVAADAEKRGKLLEERLYPHKRF